jgi:hypothetical protein
MAAWQFEGPESWIRIEIKRIFGLIEAGGGRVSPGLPFSKKTAGPDSNASMFM